METKKEPMTIRKYTYPPDGTSYLDKHPDLAPKFLEASQAPRPHEVNTADPYGTIAAREAGRAHGNKGQVPWNKGKSYKKKPSGAQQRKAAALKFFQKANKALGDTSLMAASESWLAEEHPVKFSTFCTSDKAKGHAMSTRDYDFCELYVSLGGKACLPLLLLDA